MVNHLNIGIHSLQVATLNTRMLTNMSEKKSMLRIIGKSAGFPKINPESQAKSEKYNLNDMSNIHSSVTCLFPFSWL